jgi:four helix bundle protein
MGAAMQDFTKLKVWQKAHRLAIDLKREIDKGPRWDFPGLRAQALKAAGSIADTIAEGCGKKSPLELARYADMSAASANETLGQLLRARDLGFLSERKYQEFEERIDEIRRMPWSLAQEVRQQHGGDR